jgi:hypothetical protein
MKRVIAISLLLIFISGQVNLTWATHFCGDSAAVSNSLVLGQTKLNCSSEEISCCDEEGTLSGSPSIKNIECCSDDYYSSDADDYFASPESTFKSQILFAVAFSISLFDNIYPAHKNFTQASQARFLVQTDRLVLYQTLLL